MSTNVYEHVIELYTNRVHAQHVSTGVAMTVSSLPAEPTCMATGKSVWASGGKNTSTAFFWKGWFPEAGLPTSMMWSWRGEGRSTIFITGGSESLHRLSG